jgi:hypothetical protein
MTIFAAQSALEGTFRAGAGANSVFGPGATSPTQADSFAAGTGSAAPGAHSFAQGGGCSAEGYQSFAQGRNCSATSGGDTYADYHGAFAQGYDCHSVGSYGIFTQGFHCYISGQTSFAQGARCYIETGLSFAQGYGIELIDTGFSRHIFAQGESHTTSGSMIFVQGAYHTVTGVGTQGTKGGIFAQGKGIIITGNYNFAQGYYGSITSNRSFFQGSGCKVTRDDQKTWGSNRGINPPSSSITWGKAQSSKLVKHTFTINATPVALATLDLEVDKSYVIQVKVVARNTITNTETASFVLAQATAYRDTAGSAVLVGSPVTLAGQDSGGGAAAWSVELASSGNNILLNVTGDATDRVEWCCDFEFVEVAG